MNSDKTIGIILDGPYWSDARVRNYSEQLLKRGWQLGILCFPSEVPSNADTALYEHAHFHEVKPSTFIYKSSALAYELPFYHRWCSKQAKAFHEKYPCDLWHINDIRAGLPFIKFAKANGIKCVIDLHEIRPEIMRYYAYVNKFPNKYLINLNKWKIGEKKCIEMADAAIVVTPTAQAYYEHNYHIAKAKFHVVPNSINQKFEHNGTSSGQFHWAEKKKVMLYIGDTSERRGIQTAIEALPKILKAHPEAHLGVVGSSSYDPSLKAQVQALNLQSNVTFTGWIDAGLFPEIISKSALGTCLIHRNPHHDTTLANKLFQYAGMGIPQIVTNCPAQADFIQESQCGLVIPEKDPTAFATAVDTLLSNSTDSQKMGENGRNAVMSQYVWEKVADRLVAAYHSLLSSN